MLLENRVAIVTGGAKGIGRGISLKFAEEGCSVAIADISEDEGKKTAEMASKKGKDAIFIKCDVTDNKQVQDMVKKVIDKFGKIDILVNDAGAVFGNDKNLEDITEEAWDKTIELNLKSQFLCAKAVVPHMKAKKYGKIVNLSSMGAVAPHVSVVHYHSAKGGVLGFTLNIAFELAPFNIYVNAICPGPIRTPFWDPVTKNVEDKDALFDWIAKNEVPLQRVGTPEDIAGAALFLASDLSSYVTGEVINVGGGLPLTPNNESSVHSKIIT